MRHPVATKIGKGRSIPLSPELLINMFPERAPESAKSRVVVHGTPGFNLFSSINTDKIRGLYRRLSDGTLYVVIARTLYSVTSAGVSSSLGTISGSGRVFWAESPNEIVIVAGPQSYTYNTTEGLELITSEGFPGASSVTFLDGYFIFTNRITGSKDQFFISDLLDGEVYDALDFATAESYPDNLVRVLADHSELLLFGTDSIEIWFNSGNADFPFAPAQGSVIDDGLGAAHSVEKVDESVIWLNHEGIVRRLEGNVPVRISDHAVEHLISLGDWENSYSYTYTQEGHQFYVLTVPAANNSQTAGTYVWDAATRLWHQRKSYELDYSRVGFYAKAFGKHILGDVLTGKLYEMSLDTYEENGVHLIAEIHFPQIQNDGDRFIVHKFQVDMETGHKGKTLSTQTLPVESFTGGISAITFGSNAISSIGKTINGTTWTTVTSESIAGGNYMAVHDTGGSQIVLLRYQSGQNVIAYGSSDGETWTTLNADVLGGTAPGSHGRVLMYSPTLGTGQGRLSHIGRTEYAYSDDGGSNWTVGTIAAIADNKTPSFGLWSTRLTAFYVVGTAGAGSEDNDQVITSSDGITWAADSEEIALIQEWRCIIDVDDWEMLIASGKNSQGDTTAEKIIYKPDGGAWTQATFSGAPTIDTITGIAYSSTLGLAVGVSDDSSDTYVSSTDGINWTRAQTGLIQTYSSIIWDPVNELFIAGGTGGSMATFDGTTWTDVSLSGDLANMNTIFLLASSSTSSTGAIEETFADFSGTPKAMLRVSSDTRTYGFTEPTRSIGKKGEYGTRVIWRRLGQHRSFTPILRVSDPVKRAVFTSYVEVERCAG